MPGKRILSSAAILVLTLPVSTARIKAEGNDPIHSLGLAVSNSAELHIFHFPNYMETFVALTPATLRSMATYRLVVRRKESPTTFMSLSLALNRTRVLGRVKYVDARWGCEVYSGGGRSLGSLYVDGRPIIGQESCRYAVVDNYKIEVNDALFRWFEESFSEAERRRPDG